MGRSDQVCLVMVKVPAGESRPTEPFARLGVYSLSPPPSVLKEKPKGSVCQDGKGRTHSRLTLRKAKCVASRPQASIYIQTLLSQLPPPPMRPAKPVS